MDNAVSLATYIQFHNSSCFCETRVRDKVRICFQGKLEMCGRLYRLRYSLVPRPSSKEERVDGGLGTRLAEVQLVSQTWLT